MINVCEDILQSHDLNNSVTSALICLLCVGFFCRKEKDVLLKSVPFANLFNNLKIYIR